MNGIYFFLSGKLKPWKSCFRNFDDVVEFQSHNLALQVFFYVDMPGLPLFFRMKTFPQFLINENRDLFTKSNSALFVGFQFIGGQTCGFCSNESCKGRKIKSRHTVILENCNIKELALSNFAFQPSLAPKTKKMFFSNAMMPF